MRSLSENALAKLQTRLGTEPVVIIEVQWVKDGGWQMYADRDVETSVKGKILTMGALDDVVSISDSEESQELSVVFDDTDGSLKTIMDSHDIHKRDVRVWQWFDGLALTDKFLLFSGKINSPIVWSEGDQTLSFTIISQLEDKEFGFSPEEGQFDFIPNNLIGEPWPSIFGTPNDVPALRIGEPVEGTSLAGLGTITDGTNDILGTSSVAAAAAGMASSFAQLSHLSYLASAWVTVSSKMFNQYNDQRSDLSSQISNALASAQKSDYSSSAQRTAARDSVLAGEIGANPVRILNGEYFPRGPITLIIGSGRFKGTFNSGDNDNLFYITSRSNPSDVADIAATGTADTTRSVVPGQAWNFDDRVPCGGPFGCYYKSEGWSTGLAVVPTVAGALPKYSWISSGSRVTLSGDEPISYIVSIVPGTVISVRAFKNFNGVRHFLDVPSNLYTVEDISYGSIDTVQVVLNKTLSTLEDEGWSDDLYVTFESDVGPDTVEILEYIIDLYTDFSVDTSSFDHVRTLLANYPANFAVLTRKNVLTVLQEIAFQVCCNLRLVNGVFYLTYLPEAPIHVDTITESDVDFNTLTITSTPTESLVTKMVVDWRTSYAHEDNTMIIRYNVEKYGIQEETYEFYIYNVAAFVQKAATFWIIRKGNTWKNIKFQTFMNKLNLETFDCVNLDFKIPYVSTGVIPVIITSSDADTGEYIISMECWTPVKFGEMERYNFAWLTDVDVLEVFPTANEVAWGYAGGGGIGVDAEGYLPAAPKNGGTSHSGTTGGVAGATRPAQDKQEDKQEGINSGHSDRGNKQPQEDIPYDDWYAEQEEKKNYRSNKKTTTTSNDYTPAQPMTPNAYLPDTLASEQVSLPMPTVVCDLIDLSETVIMDSSVSPTITTRLTDLIRLNTDEEELTIKTTAKFSDSENTEVFDFEFDDEGGMWGAGTAFLQ